MLQILELQEQLRIIQQQLPPQMQSQQPPHHGQLSGNIHTPPHNHESPKLQQQLTPPHQSQLMQPTLQPQVSQGHHHLPAASPMMVQAQPSSAVGHMYHHQGPAPQPQVQVVTGAPTVLPSPSSHSLQLSPLPQGPSMTQPVSQPYSVSHEPNTQSPVPSLTPLTAAQPIVMSILPVEDCEASQMSLHVHDHQMTSQDGDISMSLSFPEVRFARSLICLLKNFHYLIALTVLSINLIKA